MRNAFGAWFADHVKNDADSVLLSGDIGYRIFDDLIEHNPDRFINCGIAEQNMIGLGAGLASQDFKPWIYTIIPFLIYRPYEFIRNLIAYQNLNVNLVGVGGGVAYDSLGFTHYALEDLSLIAPLSNIDIYLPYDPVSAVKCFKNASENPNPTYIRLQKGGEQSLDIIEEKQGYDIVEKVGDEICIVCHGYITQEYAGLTASLSNHGIKAKLIAIWDATKFLDLTKEFGKSYTYFIEEHVCGGLFHQFSHRENTMVLSIEHSSLTTYKSRLEILFANGLSKEQLLSRIIGANIIC